MLNIYYKKLLQSWQFFQSIFWRVSRLSGIESEEDWEGFTVGLNLNPTNYHHPATQGPEPGHFRLDFLHPGVHLVFLARVRLQKNFKEENK